MKSFKFLFIALLIISFVISSKTKKNKLKNNKQSTIFEPDQEDEYIQKKQSTIFEPDQEDEYVQKKQSTIFEPDQEDEYAQKKQKILYIPDIYAQKQNSNYYSKNADDYLQKEDITCDTATNCREPNFCSQDKKTCFCAKGLANYPFDGYKGQYCTYSQHTQLAGFLWELFLNIGVGHFNIGQNLMGTFKLIVMVVPIIIQILGLVGLIKVGLKEGNVGTFTAILSYIFFLTAFAWWLADAIMFGTNKYRDRNDVPLKKW